jgi:hypothetical protein
LLQTQGPLKTKHDSLLSLFNVLLYLTSVITRCDCTIVRYTYLTQKHIGVILLLSILLAIDGCFYCCRLFHSTHCIVVSVGSISYFIRLGKKKHTSLLGKEPLSLTSHYIIPLTIQQIQCASIHKICSTHNKENHSDSVHTLRPTHNTTKPSPISSQLLSHSQYNRTTPTQFPNILPLTIQQNHSPLLAY